MTQHGFPRIGSGQRGAKDFQGVFSSGTHQNSGSARIRCTVATASSSGASTR
jgi:hypothetical protein